MGELARSRAPIRTGLGRRVGFAALLVAWVSFAATARAQEPSPAAAGGAAEQSDVAEIGQKLANPVSDVWALFTEFDLEFSDGNVNEGGAELGGDMVFQPILPFPLYGSGDNAWKLITRPTFPAVFSTPIPKGFNDFDNEGGLGDTTVPILVSPPTGNWILGAGVNWLLPTSTREVLGDEQWGVGPTGVVGYKNKELTMGVFPQYYFGFASRGDRESDTRDVSKLSMLYFLFYNLPDAWQIGFNPTITYDDQAPSGDKWNVPIGLTVAKTTRIGRVPVKFQVGIEYSVVSQNDFGQVAQLKFNVIPVMPSLVKEPILGGR